MAMVTVYRIENSDGKGAYVTYSGHWSKRSHSCGSGHPGPWQDEGIQRWLKSYGKYDEEFMNDLIKPYNFGFISLESLDAWFNEEERGRLLELGYRVVAYTVDYTDIIVGSKQIMFKKDRATLVPSVESYWINTQFKVA